MTQARNRGIHNGSINAISLKKLEKGHKSVLQFVAPRAIINK